MRRYFCNLRNMWLPCFANSRAQAMDMLGNQPDEILTEREALKRAEQGDKDLANAIQSSFMCDLMCN